MASAQTVFGVVAPFLYRELARLLGRRLSARSLSRLAELAISLLGEHHRLLRPRPGKPAPWRSAPSPFAARAVCLAASGVLIGTGVIRPRPRSVRSSRLRQHLPDDVRHGALGLVDRNLRPHRRPDQRRLLSLHVSGAMAIAAVLPEVRQAPLGGLPSRSRPRAARLLPSVLPGAAPRIHLNKGDQSIATLSLSVSVARLFDFDDPWKHVGAGAQRRFFPTA